MNETDQGFERELRTVLSRLADEAPASPLPGRIVGKLRRRTMFRRWAGGGIAAAGLLVACAAVWALVASQHSFRTSLGGAAREVPPSKTGPQLPDPLPANADQMQIDAALHGCFASSNVRGNILVTKTRGEGLSFCATGGDILTDKLRAGLTQVLEQFESVTIYMRNGELAYTLVAAQTS